MIDATVIKSNKKANDEFFSIYLPTAEIQEIIQNILKHANAMAIVRELNNTGKLIELYIGDTGVGFKPETAKQKRPGQAFRILWPGLPYCIGE